MSDAQATPTWVPTRLRWGAFSVGVLGLVLCAFGGLLGAPVFPSYLFALLFWLGISLGCLAISMLHHVVGGHWGVLVRRTFEAGALLLPLLGLLFIPILFGLSTLYPWARPDEVAGDPILLHKQPYLTSRRLSFVWWSTSRSGARWRGCSAAGRSNRMIAMTRRCDGAWLRSVAPD